ncbi:unnamed protein product [Gongylonema pulchrum]|uniref:Uncharacterized protein n=1 Tax=Gongylonema pulchrum TaxID=637853 RepID=A0A183EKS6_9BILA|nr:unnamed protein product [Gongylonema pulchrum]
MIALTNLMRSSLELKVGNFSPKFLYHLSSFFKEYVFLDTLKGKLLHFNSDAKIHNKYGRKSSNWLHRNFDQKCSVRQYDDHSLAENVDDELKKTLAIDHSLK